MTDFFSDENMVPTDPLIFLLHLRTAYANPYCSEREKNEAREAIMKEVFDHSMRPYYTFICDMFAWPINDAACDKMDIVNKAIVDAIDAKLSDATENLGDTEVRDALQRKCDHYARIGDLDNCIKFNEECFQKTLAAGPKLDLCFQRIRLGISFGNNDIAAKGIQAAHKFMKEGDWERRNRLIVYEGLYHVFVRNFEKGSKMLINSLSTFASTELLDYRQFVFIAVISALPTLSRQDLKEKVVDSPELSSTNLKNIQKLVNSVYFCKYGEVFPALASVCQDMQKMVFLMAHVHYFFREVRVLIFNQFLDSYSSVTLKYMSAAFGIPQAVLDQMLYALISNGRIACTIDRVAGTIVTYRGDAFNFQYHKIVKTGDLLLNRIQKLSRLIEM